MSTIIFAGGGSAGHIAPSIAVAEELLRVYSSMPLHSRVPIRIHFICSSNPDDKAFIEKNGFECSIIDAPGLSPGLPWKFPAAVRQSKKILQEINPDVLFAKGGYASLPAAYAAHKMKIPIVLHESDAVSGRANRVVRRWADHVCLGMADQSQTASLRTLARPQVTGHRSQVKYPAASGRLTHRNFGKDGRSATFTGNPVRRQVTQGSAEEGLHIAGLEEGNRPVMLVIGGSKGAEALNEFVRININGLLKLTDVIHITGKNKKGCGRREGYCSLEFANEELPHFYAASSIAISRAGANIITELAANRIPAILIPLRGVGHDHQQKNAELAFRSGGFTIIQQKEMDEKLLQTINSLLTSSPGPSKSASGGRSGEQPETLRLRSGQTSDLYRPDASRQIAEILLKYLAPDFKAH